MLTETTNDQAVKSVKKNYNNNKKLLLNQYLICFIVHIFKFHIQLEDKRKETESKFHECLNQFVFILFQMICIMRCNEHSLIVVMNFTRSITVMIIMHIEFRCCIH